MGGSYPLLVREFQVLSENTVVTANGPALGCRYESGSRGRFPLQVTLLFSVTDVWKGLEIR